MVERGNLPTDGLYRSYYKQIKCKNVFQVKFVLTGVIISPFLARKYSLFNYSVYLMLTTIWKKIFSFGIVKFSHYKNDCRWEVPSASGFCIEPTFGAVRGNATLYVYAHYTADYSKVNYAQAIIKCESGSCMFLRLSISRLAPKVEFISDHTNLGEIPLNLPTKVIAVLRNFDINDVTYEVDSASLTHGCDVNPPRGKIPARGIAILEVCPKKIKFDTYRVVVYIVRRRRKCKLP